jgi:hypothetical protein
MFRMLRVLSLFGVVLSTGGADLSVTLDRGGNLGFGNAFTAGVVNVQTRATLNPNTPWISRSNYYTTNTVGSVPAPINSTQGFFRLLSVDISTNTFRHYTNLLESYGILETVAGRGKYETDVSHWSNVFEGEWATNVDLSRPHISFGDPHGNVLIVDQRSSAVLKVTPQGRLYTYAGTHIAGFNGDGPGPATNLHLNNPNGGWMAADGTFYILDTANAKVRKVTTNQEMSTVFTVPFALGDGRAFWINRAETLAYFGSGPTEVTNLNKWVRGVGVSLVRTGFGDMGNILGDERTGDLYISDRNAYRVYRMDTNGNMITIAGNGTPTGSGGEGSLATATSLNLPRSIWFIPNGGFFIGEHHPGNRIWYVDPAGIIHRWMNGDGVNRQRVGDGQWFYANPGLAKVSRVRAVNTDPFGNLIITESNYGYVRRINFRRINP